MEVDRLLSHSNSTCAGCLRRLPTGERRWFCNASNRVAWSAHARVVVPLGVAFCNDCCPGGRQPRLPRQLAGRAWRNAASHTGLRSQGLRKRPSSEPEAVPKRVEQLDSSAEVCAIVHELWEFIDRGQHVVAAPLPQGLQFESPALADRSLMSTFVHAFCGAPSADAFDLLHDELFVRAPHGTTVSPFPFRSVSSRTGLAMCLAHLHENASMEALRALFALGSTSTCLAVTDFVFAALLQFARTAPLSSGGVRPVTADMLQQSRGAVSRHSQGRAPADIAGIADCTSIFVTKPSGDQQLRRQLFDGEQYNDTWVKVFIACDPCGYIMRVNGPYAPAGRAADCEVFQDSLLGHPAMLHYLTNKETAGTWLADYGFRGVFMPSTCSVLLPRKARDGVTLSREDALHNERITSVRWVIEAVNARVKKFKMLSTRRPWEQLTVIHQWVEVAALLVNRWCQPVLAL